MSRSGHDEPEDDPPVRDEPSSPDSETIARDRSSRAGDDSVLGTQVVDRADDDLGITDAGALGDGRSRIGRYRIERELARGGQAVVYLAVDEQLDRKVAIKVLRGGDLSQPTLLKRFQREAAIVSQLDDPGICSVYDAGIADGLAYIAMQYVRGATFADWLKERWDEVDRASSSSGESTNSDRRRGGRSTSTRELIDEALVVVESAARSLQVAHDAGVIHRDIKSANIMMTEDGRPVIVDFGLARAAELQQETLTISGDLFGTPLYMSPEQVEGHALDRRSDVYSLGVVLFEAVTGRRPFTAATREALYRIILHDDAPDVRSIRPDLPPDLAIVVATALEKDRDRRYQSAGDLADDIGRLRRHELIRAKPLSRWFRFRRLCQRNPLAAALVLLLFVVLAAGLGLTLAKNVELERQRNRSEWNAYAAQIAAAVAAEHAADSAGMIKALGRTNPQLRSWEWRHLSARAEQQLGIIEVPDGTMPIPVPDDDRFVWVAGDRLARAVAGSIEDQRQALWLIDVERQEIVRRIAAPLPFYRYAVTRDGRRLLFYGRKVGLPPRSDSLMAIDVESGAAVWRRDGEFYFVERNQISPDGRATVIGTLDGFTTLDVATGRDLKTIAIGRGRDECDAYLLSNDFVFVRHSIETQDSAYLRVVDIRTGEIAWRGPEDAEITAVDVDQEEGRVLYVRALAGTTADAGLGDQLGRGLTIHDVDDGEYLVRDLPETSLTGFLDADTIGRTVPGSLEIRSIRTGQLLGRRLGPAIGGVVVRALGGRRILSTEGDGRVFIWPGDLEHSPWFAPVDANVSGPLDSKGELAAGATWGKVVVTRARDGALVFETGIGRADVVTLAFSPDDRSLLALDRAGQIVILDVASGETRRRWRRPLPGRCRDAIWSASGEAVILVDRDDRIWRLELDGDKAELVAEFSRPVGPLLVRPDGRSLVVGLGAEPDAVDRGGRLVLLDLANGATIAQTDCPAPVTALAETSRPPLASGRSELVLAGDSAGGCHALAPGDLEILKTIATGQVGVASLQWCPEIGRLLVAAGGSILLFDYEQGIELFAMPVPQLTSARYLAARDAIFLARNRHGSTFGWLEVSCDEQLAHRRRLQQIAFKEVTNRMRRLQSLEATRAELTAAEFDPELRRLMDERLERTIENPADLNSTAWGLALPADRTEADYREAVVKARKALAALPDDWGIHNTLSMALLRCGLYEDSLASIEAGLPHYRALGREGMSPHDRAMRAIALHHLGRTEEAREEARAARRDVDPADTESLATIVEAESLLGIDDD